MSTLPTPPSAVPCDYLDKLCLSGTSREHGISGAPVWQLHVHGEFDGAIARRALASLVRRYPLLVSRVEAADGRGDPLSARALVYRPDPEPRLDALWRREDWRGLDAAQRAVARQRLFDHHIDPPTEYPARFTWARLGDDRGVLHLQQHHAIADGKAFFALIRDFCEHYAQVAAGDEPRVDGPVARLPEAPLAEPRAGRRAWMAAAGLAAHTRRLAWLALHPRQPLVCNLGTDYRGANRVRHVLLDEALLARLAPLKRDHGLSSNDALTAALALATARWSADEGVVSRRFTILLPADVRPRGVAVESFANHLTSYLVDVDLDRVGEAGALMRDVRRQIGDQRRRQLPLKKLLAEIAVSRWLSPGRIRSMVLGMRSTPINLSFSNLLPISPREGGGRFGAAGWTADALRIMTPAPFLQGVAVTAIRYAGALCFNFNHTASVVGDGAVERYAGRFVEAVDEVAAQAAGG